VLRAMRLDPTRLLLWGGAAALAFTLHSPYAAAEAIAASDSRALTTVRALAAAGLPPQDEAGFARWLAAVHERCAAAGLPPEALPAPVDGARERVRLAAGEWLFLVARAPALPGESPPPETLLEAWAWPRDDAARSNTVFCARPEGTWATRNLTGRYSGERAPEPGGARRRKPESTEPDYWGVDGQFWRRHP